MAELFSVEISCVTSQRFDTISALSHLNNFERVETWNFFGLSFGRKFDE
jgi:hypothetical protein